MIVIQIQRPFSFCIAYLIYISTYFLIKVTFGLAYMFLEGLVTKQSLAGYFLSCSSSPGEVLVLAHSRRNLTFDHVHLEFQP